MHTIRARCRWPLLVAPLLLLLAAAAQGNMGTPLMLGAWCHLVFLNFGIAMLEASLLSRLFRLPYQRALPFMVAANYVSAAVGAAVLGAASLGLSSFLAGRPPLFRAPTVLGVLLCASLPLTVVLEWPFCWWAGRPLSWTWRRAFGASAIAQVVSYALLVPFYWLISPTSLYRNATIERDVRFAKPPIATVFYIDAEDGAVWQIRTDGTGKRKVLAAGLRDTNARLFAEPDAKSGRCDLWQVSREAWASVALPAVGSGCAGWRVGRTGERTPPDTWFSFGRPLDLRAEASRQWTVQTGFWAAEGLHVCQGDKERYWLAFETPFAGWIWRNATVLPNDQVVVQLGLGGDSQIVLLDMHTRQLGVLAMGQGPAVVLRSPLPGKRASVPHACLSPRLTTPLSTP